MDDDIIYSWCFNDVECFDSTPSAALIILVKVLESFSSLISKQSRHLFISFNEVLDLDIIWLVNLMILSEVLILGNLC